MKNALGTIRICTDCEHIPLLTTKDPNYTPHQTRKQISLPLTTIKSSFFSWTFSSQKYSHLNLGLRARGTTWPKLVLNTRKIRPIMSSERTFRENSLFSVLLIHNWAYLWLKSNALWEGTCSVDKRLCPSNLIDKTEKQRC